MIHGGTSHEICGCDNFMQKEMKKKEIEFPIDWELKIGSCMI
jgi:hypothetical protein